MMHINIKTNSLHMTDLMADFLMTINIQWLYIYNSALFPKFVKVEGGEALKLHVIDLREQPPHAVALYLTGNVLTLTVAV